MTQSLQRSSGEGDSWRSLPQFENLYTEMDRLAQSVLGGRNGEGAWLPEADIVETESAYIVEIELPGVWHQDIDLSLNGNELVVTGEVKERKREGLFRRRTRKIGEFEFRAVLPGQLKEDEVEASLAFGVLRVYVPKAERVTAHKIPISESSGGSH